MTKIDEKDPQGPLDAPYIKLYTLPTPNGIKVSIFLELLGLEYHTRSMSFKDNENKEPWFVELNANGKIPVLSDVDSAGNRVTISESMAILYYLAEKYDVDRKFSYATDSQFYWKQMEWSLFQMASLGPGMGQLAHYSLFASEKIEYAITRSKTEVERLFGIMESRLEQNGLYLVGDHLSIADVLPFGWINGAHKLGFDVQKDYPGLYKWLENMKTFEGVRKGADLT